MTRWIEDVGKPALDSQNTLLRKLRKKDGEWKSALADLERLKDMNTNLQEVLRKRPTKEQHKGEQERGVRLTMEIQELEQEL